MADSDDGDYVRRIDFQALTAVAKRGELADWLAEAADALDAAAEELVPLAVEETRLPPTPRLKNQPTVAVLASGAATLLSVRAKDFLKADEIVRSECFGPASIVVTYASHDELLEALANLEPGLTATVHAQESEIEDVRTILPALTRLAGRLLWNDWPTGVTVSWAQQHGGPYPATTTPTTTSVGTAAIDRFLPPRGLARLPRHTPPAAVTGIQPLAPPTPHRRRTLRRPTASTQAS